MDDLAKLRQGRGAHSLGGRIGGNELRVLRFECLQLAHEPVELGVRDLGLVEDVIPVVVVLDVLAQAAEARGRLVTFRHGRRRRAGAPAPGR